MTSTAHAPGRSGRRHTLLSSVVGAVVEWYEYTIYATSAALVFAPLFFPSDNPAASQIAAFASFGVGFVARPIGAWVAGHYGDRIGRKATLLATFTVMTAATAAIGLLPDYGAIGLMAPVLLCLLRLLQGFAVGGEWGGAAIVAAESARSDRRGFAASWPQIGVSSGLLLGTLAVAGSQLISGDEFMTWGWRLPFLLSIPLAAVGLYIRLRATESQAFLRARDAGSTAPERAPIVEVVRSHRRALATAVAVGFGHSGTYYLFTVFLIAYVAGTLGVPAGTGLLAVIVGSSLNILLMPVAGLASDRFGRRWVLGAGAALLIVSIWPILLLVGTGRTWAIVLGIAFYLGAVHTLLYGPLPALFTELFPTRVRYTGISVSYQFNAVLLSGFGPALFSVLVAWSGSVWPLALFGMLMGVMTIVGVASTRETRGTDLDDVGARPRQAVTAS
ncbi:MFS transporter [Pseudonocardia kongjuensis]|uniref:MFS transporter n=1 Tax=Pseudonocardia kongjuensis TaxID=102227 RepID=A0ABN1XUZ7_9PSEU